jgi:cytochrome P450
MNTSVNASLDTPATPSLNLPAGGAPRPPLVKGLPVIGSTLKMAANPARFFHDSYREYGPCFRVRVFGHDMTVIAGAEAANFMGTREGKDSLRSREAWEPMVQEMGMTKNLVYVDGDLHKELRAIQKWGFSKEAMIGRYNKILDITADALARDWKVGTDVPVVQAMQYLVVEQLGTLLTGRAPREYVKDIRTTILYMLNVLVTRQRPKFFLQFPEYKRAKARMVQLGKDMVAEYRANKDRRTVTPENRTLIDDIMEAHERNPELIPECDLPWLVSGPYVAGLDTVAMTTSACLYTILKYPENLARMREEVDALYAKGPVDEATYMKSLPVTNSIIMETMRLYPIAVAQVRVANKDFVFCGHQLLEGELVYIGTSVPHFQHEYYPNPEKFDTERYDKSRAEHMQSGAYSPYGRGPHTCLGKSMAEVILVMTMSKIIYHLDLELPSPDYVLKTKAAPTPGPAMSFRVKVKGRRR